MGRQETIGRRGVESGGNERGRVICHEAVKEFGGTLRKSVEKRWMKGGIGRPGGGRTWDVGTVEIGVENGANDRTNRFQQNEMKSREIE